MTGIPSPGPLVRCPVCGDEWPRDLLGDHAGREHRPPTRPTRPTRRTARLGGRGRSRR